MTINPGGGSVRSPDRIDVVVVPLDGSELAQRALPVAARLARRLDAEVLLLSAVPEEDDVDRRDAELAAITLGSGRAPRREVVVDPDPAGAIHEALRRNRTAIACMATHGRGRSAALVGSVATEVVARGHDPLVLVGPLVGDRVRGEGVGVVTCLDGTPASTGIATLGLGWARLVVEPLVLLTVAEPVPPPVREGAPYRRFGPDDPDAFLKEVAADLPGDAPVDTVAVFDPISPAEGVRSYLRDKPAYLVMVASHARTGVALLVFGSTAGNVVHHSRSPVLVIPRQSASGLEGGQR